ncbi:MAG: hypothetical protein PVG66_07545 [Chromatiales bacterium]|jgi:hypothetical protein
MDEIEVTWMRATHIYWSLAWRWVLFSMLAGAIAGALLGVALGFLDRTENLELYGQIIGFVVSIPVGIWVVKTVMTKQYRHYRIALLPSNEALLEQSIKSLDD